MPFASISGLCWNHASRRVDENSGNALKARGMKSVFAHPTRHDIGHNIQLSRIAQWCVRLLKMYKTTLCYDTLYLVRPM